MGVDWRNYLFAPVLSPGRFGAEKRPRGRHDADVVEAHVEAKHREDLPDRDRRDLHAGVDGGADGTPQGVPRLVVVPAGGRGQGRERMTCQGGRDRKEAGSELLWLQEHGL